MATLNTSLLGVCATILGPATLLADLEYWFPALRAGARVSGGGSDLPATHPTLELDCSGPRALPDAVAAITEFAVTRSPLLCLHAGVVAIDHRCLVIPGVSGTGKTTLTAAMLQAGLSYLSDEVLALDRTDFSVVGFARPLLMIREQWPVLGLPGEPPARDIEQPIRPDAFGRTLRGFPAVTDVLLTRRRPGPLSLEAEMPGVAVAELLQRCFNHYRDPSGSVAAISELVRNARIWRAEYEEAPELAATMAARLVGSGSSLRDAADP
jgi:hypothetical protein